MTHLSVGNNEHASACELGSPTEVDVLTPASDPRVETTDRSEKAGAYQHTGGRHGEHVADSIVLLLISLSGLNNVGCGSKLVDDEAHVLQDFGLLPFDELGASDPGVGAQRLGDKHAHGVRGQGDIVVTHEHKRRVDIGLKDGVGRSGEPDRVRCVDQGCVRRHSLHPLVEAALARHVDDDKFKAGVILGDNAFECLLEPDPRIVSHHDGSNRRRRSTRFARHVGAHVGDWDVGHGLRRLPPDSATVVALHTRTDDPVNGTEDGCPPIAPNLESALMTAPLCLFRI